MRQTHSSVRVLGYAERRKCVWWLRAMIWRREESWIESRVCHMLWASHKISLCLGLLISRFLLYRIVERLRCKMWGTVNQSSLYTEHVYLKHIWPTYTLLVILTRVKSLNCWFLYFVVFSQSGPTVWADKPLVSFIILYLCKSVKITQ